MTTKRRFLFIARNVLINYICIQSYIKEKSLTFPPFLKKIYIYVYSFSHTVVNFIYNENFFFFCVKSESKQNKIFFFLGGGGGGLLGFKKKLLKFPPPENFVRTIYNTSVINGNPLDHTLRGKARHMLITGRSWLAA